jgi:hypothetical protein
MVVASSLGGGRAYLWAAVLARGANDVVRGGRPNLAHAVFADLVFLRIVFYLWWGQPRAVQCSSAGSTSVWSVLQVPLLSTGDGSTVAGYGLGGARWSEVFEDLGESISRRPRVGGDGGGGGHQHMGSRTYLRRRARMGPASWASPCRG